MAGPQALAGLGAVGAGLHVSGSVLIVVGQLLVRISHCIKDSGAAASWGLPKTSSALTPRWRRPDGKWRRQLAGSKTYSAAGWGLFALGNAARFVSMRFAAQTVLSGLGSLQFVVIPIASRHLLGIKPTPATIVGLAVVLLGNVLILMFGPAEVSLTLHQLRYQWTTSSMQTFLLVLGSLLAGLHFLWRQLRRSLAAQQVAAARAAELSAASGASLADVKDGKEPSTPPPPLSISISTGSSNGASVAGALEAGRPSDLLLQLAGSSQTLQVYAGALLFSAVASFIGAWSVLFSKSLTYVVGGMPASLWDWYSWLVLLAFLGTAAFWIRQSDRGLKLYPATLIMPLMQAFWMCMSVLQGGVYFGEFSSLAPQDLTWLLLGVLLSLAGAIGMGVSGYAFEQPQNTLAYALSPKSSSLSDIESQELLSLGRPGGAGSTGVQLNLLTEKLAAASSRAEQGTGLSSPVFRATRPTLSSSHSPGPGSKAWLEGDVGGAEAGGHRSSDDDMLTAEAAALLPPADRRLSRQGSAALLVESGTPGAAATKPIETVITSSAAPLGGLMQRMRAWT